MSKYLAIVNGEILKYRIAKEGVDGIRTIHLGDQHVGFIARVSNSWNVISTKYMRDIGVVSGFKTMKDTINFIEQLRILSGKYYLMDKLENYR